MADHAAASAAPVHASEGFLARHHFLLRRLHSLTGIVPVGVFVIMHLFTNAQMIFWSEQEGAAFFGPEAFQSEVDFIHSLPALLFIEVLLWASLGFHALLGVAYMMGIAPNTRHYRYQANWRYTLQRVTAWIALVFILLHIATLRWRLQILDFSTPFYSTYELAGTEEAVPMSLPLTAYALQIHWAVLLAYVVGVLAVIFHWCNGLWTAAITWGATLTPSAMKRWGYACLGLALLLTVFMAAALIGAYRFDLQTDTTPQQRAVLQKIVPSWTPDPAGVQGAGPAALAE